MGGVGRIQVAVVTAVQAVITILSAVQAAHIKELDAAGFAGRQGATSMAVWLRDALRISIHAAHRLTALAALTDSRPEVVAAVADGTVTVEQAAVIDAALCDLPRDLDPEITTSCQKVLIDEAKVFEPAALRRIGERILAHVAPEVAEEALARKLERDEHRANTARGFTMSTPVNGIVRISGSITVEAAAVIQAAIEPLCKPRPTTNPTNPAASPTSPATSTSPATAANPSAANANDTDGGDGDGGARGRPGTCACGRDARGRHSTDTNGTDASGMNGTDANAADAIGASDPDVSGHAPGGTAPTPDTATTDPRRRNTEASDTDAGRASTEPGNNEAGNNEPGGAQPSVSGPTVSEPAACEPDQPSPGSRDLRTAAQRRADALEDICRLALATNQLPEHGGQRPAVTVTLDYDTLTQQIGTTTLNTGEPISASAARRIACDARIIPAILNTNAEVLDVGRSRRLFTGPLRHALNLRDQGCTFPACDRPPAWCDGHHIRSWLDGGPTNLTNAVLLCRRHHHDGWQIHMAEDGHPDFTPPPHIDPLQRAQRNHYPRSTSHRHATPYHLRK